MVDQIPIPCAELLPTVAYADLPPAYEEKFSIPRSPILRARLSPDDIKNISTHLVQHHAHAFNIEPSEQHVKTVAMYVATHHRNAIRMEAGPQGFAGTRGNDGANGLRGFQGQSCVGPQGSAGTCCLHADTQERIRELQNHLLVAQKQIQELLARIQKLEEPGKSPFVVDRELVTYYHTF